MGNLAFPPSSLGGRFGKAILVVMASFIVLVLMAVSFALGRATLGDARSTTPVTKPGFLTLPLHIAEHQTTGGPTQLPTPERRCSHPGRC
jgi:hypothetical protein